MRSFECPLWANSIGFLERQASNIGTRAREVRNETRANWIRLRSEHDRDGLSSLFCREDWCGAPCHNDIDVKPDELSCNLGESFSAAFRPAILYGDGATLDPTKLP